MSDLAFPDKVTVYHDTGYFLSSSLFKSRFEPDEREESEFERVVFYTLEGEQNPEIIYAVRAKAYTENGVMFELQSFFNDEAGLARTPVAVKGSTAEREQIRGYLATNTLPVCGIDNILIFIKH